VTLRVVVADDHPVVREGLRALLDAEPDVEVVGQAGDGDDTVRLVARLRPDVVVLDLVMPGPSGMDTVRELSRRTPATRVLVLSMHHDEAHVVEALQSGASGYALKQADAGEFVRGVREVGRGRRYLSPPLSERALEAYARRAATATDPFETLTGREREIVALVVEGLTNAEIGQRLFISRRTVETHRANAMKKLGKRTQADLVRDAVRRQGALRAERD
jgi:DNA-binding NarL/FixJ family response regulator